MSHAETGSFTLGMELNLEKSIQTNYLVSRKHRRKTFIVTYNGRSTPSLSFCSWIFLTRFSSFVLSRMVGLWPLLVWPKELHSFTVLKILCTHIGFWGKVLTKHLWLPSPQTLQTHPFNYRVLKVIPSSSTWTSFQSFESSPTNFSHLLK